MFRFNPALYASGARYSSGNRKPIEDQVFASDEPITTLRHIFKGVEDTVLEYNAEYVTEPVSGLIAVQSPQSRTMGTAVGQANLLNGPFTNITFFGTGTYFHRSCSGPRSL
jgi:hypothetical protein